jgi:hypothetical protein
MSVSQAWIDANGAVTAALIAATLGVDVSTVAITPLPPGGGRRLSDTQLLLSLSPSAAGVGLSAQVAEVTLSAADWLLDMDTAIVPGLPAVPTVLFASVAIVACHLHSHIVSVSTTPQTLSQSAATSSASSGRRASPPAAAPAGSARWTAPCP